MKSIKDFNDLDKKTILLRLDLNVPLDNGKILDATRINKIIPTLDFLIKKNVKIIILSHVGRPKGKIVNELSLEPICKNLINKTNINIKLITKNIKKMDSKNLFDDSEYRIIMFENLRFYIEEEEDNDEFAKHLASFADIYVNDAFSCSHRKHASVHKITNFIPSYSGLQLDSEINALKKITSEIERPITCIIGGSKISTKIKIIKNLIKKFDNIIIVGGMANNIFKYKGFEIGKSIIENNCNEIVDEIFTLSEKENCQIIYPEDVAIGNSFSDSKKIKQLDNVSENDIILDIGPKTIKKIIKIIQESKTVLWNGPAGYFENINFANGSQEIAKQIAEDSKNGKLFSVVGGGDTISVINKIKMFNNYNFVSTAGGAFLEYLEGKDLPGIKALN